MYLDNTMQYNPKMQYKLNFPIANRSPTSSRAKFAPKIAAKSNVKYCVFAGDFQYFMLIF